MMSKKDGYLSCSGLDTGMQEMDHDGWRLGRKEG